MDLDACTVCFATLLCAEELYCSDFCRRSDQSLAAHAASSSSLSRPRLVSCSTAASASTTPATASTSTRSQRPQLTIAMPRAFAPPSPTSAYYQHEHQTRSAITPSKASTLASLTVPMPTREQLSSRSRRYTAPSSSRCSPSLTPTRFSPAPAFPSKRLVPPSFRHAASYASPESLAQDVAALSDAHVGQSPSSPLRARPRPRMSFSGLGLGDDDDDDEDASGRLLSNQTITRPAARRYVSSAPNPHSQQQQQQRSSPMPVFAQQQQQQLPTPAASAYTGGDRLSVMGWVAQVKLHTPPLPPTAVIPHSPRQGLRKSSSGAPMSKMGMSPLSLSLAVSKPALAPPVITAPDAHQAPYSPSSLFHPSSLLRAPKLKSKFDDEVVEMDEALTLVTPPSSSALDTLSFSSFRFDDEPAMRGMGSLSSFGEDMDDAREVSGSASASGGAKTLSPPPPSVHAPATIARASPSSAATPMGRVRKGNFTIGAARDSCASSYSSSSYSSSSCSSSSSHSRSASPHARMPASSRLAPENQMYSLEDLLAAGAVHSTSPGSRFSDVSEEDEDEEEEEEEQVEVDLWQSRGRAPRVGIAAMLA